MARKALAQGPGRRASSVVAAAMLAGCVADGVDLDPPPAVGLTIGEVTATSAVTWSRAKRTARLAATLTDGEFEISGVSAPALARGDFTARVVFDSLKPDTRYRVTARFVDAADRPLGELLSGAFRTAPDAAAPTPVSFLFGGDLAGQNVCRDADRGFPIFAALADIDADFFIGLGDMIYADSSCRGTGKYGNAQVAGRFPVATDLPAFHAHWRYVLEDPAYRALRRRMSYLAVWDDHEVTNDFGPHDDRVTPGGPRLMPPGLQAFVDYNPFPFAAVNDTPPTLYRARRWGRHAELFLLDTRRYRDSKSADDSGAVPKTLLGATQRDWLVRSVTASDATWKIVVTSVPLSIPTGWPPAAGRDGWADDGGPTGFERELRALMGAFRDAGVRNLLWLSADVHFGSGFRYRPFADTPDFVVYELVTGPLSAGLFAKRDLDTSLNPTRLFFYGPADFNAVTTFAEATTWMNAGLIRIDADGRLAFELVNGNGQVVETLTLEPDVPAR